MRILKLVICLLLLGVFASNVEAAWPYAMTYTPSVGDTILSAHINTSNNEHINNNIPESIDDYSANVAELQSTKDLYAGDTEVLPLTIAEELEGLRRAVWEAKAIVNPSLAVTDWYKNVGAIRTVRLKLEPGATPGTNIDVDDVGLEYNGPAITIATDLAKSGEEGSFSLNSGGTQLTMDITEDVIGVLSTVILFHDLNSSSTTEMYTVSASLTGGNMIILLHKRGSIASVDLTTILDAGDRCDILICFITDS